MFFTNRNVCQNRSIVGKLRFCCCWWVTTHGWRHCARCGPPPSFYTISFKPMNELLAIIRFFSNVIVKFHLTKKKNLQRHVFVFFVAFDWGFEWQLGESVFLYRQIGSSSTVQRPPNYLYIHKKWIRLHNVLVCFILWGKSKLKRKQNKIKCDLKYSRNYFIENRLLN